MVSIGEAETIRGEAETIRDLRERLDRADQRIATESEERRATQAKLSALLTDLSAGAKIPHD